MMRFSEEPIAWIGLQVFKLILYTPTFNQCVSLGKAIVAAFVAAGVLILVF